MSKQRWEKSHHEKCLQNQPPTSEIFQGLPIPQKEGALHSQTTAEAKAKDLPGNSWLIRRWLQVHPQKQTARLVPALSSQFLSAKSIWLLAGSMLSTPHRSNPTATLQSRKRLEVFKVSQGCFQKKYTAVPGKTDLRVILYQEYNYRSVK